MEMSPDTLEADGVNDLFVVVTVDTSFTTEQTASGSSGTGSHRRRITEILRFSGTGLRGPP
jgi:hypothetical protein